MAVTRKIRIEYYQVVKVLRGGTGTEGKKFNLEELIRIADSLGLSERIFEYYQEKARLDKIKYNQISKYWYLNFVKLRQTKIPSKAKKNEEATPIRLGIDEYIGEEVAALYDVENGIFALQRNRDSLSATGIESYFSSLYGSKDYDICLRPIKPDDVDVRLGKAKVYRKLTMRFADLPIQKYSGDKNSSFHDLLKYFNRFSANTATITISMGRVQKKTLEPDTINEAIREINNNRGLVDAAEVTIKNSEIDPVDTIDLFSMKSYDFISLKVEPRETIDFSALADEMHKKYNRSKDTLIKRISE